MPPPIAGSHDHAPQYHLQPGVRRIRSPDRTGQSTGATRTIVYDASGRAIARINPLGGRGTTVYDGLGNLVGCIAPPGRPHQPRLRRRQPLDQHDQPPGQHGNAGVRCGEPPDRAGQSPWATRPRSFTTWPPSVAGSTRWATPQPPLRRRQPLDQHDQPPGFLRDPRLRCGRPADRAGQPAGGLPDDHLRFGRPGYGEGQSPGEGRPASPSTRRTGGSARPTRWASSPPGSSTRRAA